MRVDVPAVSLRWTEGTQCADEGANETYHGKAAGMSTPRKRIEILFDYFLDHEGEPVSTFTLERLAGRRSWRSRVSDCRARARLVRRNIINTQPRVYRRGKLVAVTSFYTLVRTGKGRAA